MQRFDLPTALILDPQITYSAKLLGSILYSRGSETVTMTLAELAKTSGVSMTTVQKALQELKHTGHIREGQRGQHNKRTYILPEVSDALVFVPVPLAILDLQVTPSAYSILFFFYYEAWTGKQLPSLRNISNSLGMSVSTVCRSLKELGDRQQLYEQIKRDLF